MSLNKGELIKICQTDTFLKDVDVGRPIEFDKECERIGINPLPFVFDFTGNTVAGKPVNLILEFYWKIIQDAEIVSLIRKKLLQ